MPLPDGVAARVAGWVRRRRLLVATLLALLALRAALPPILRSVLVSRLNGTLTGRAEVGDVDLWLLRGAVALDDVALHGEGAAADRPPLVGLRRVYVNVGWFALLRHTARVQDFALDGLRVDLDRLRTGEVVLPALRPGPPAEEPPAPAPPEAPAGTPWNVLVDHAALTDGHFRLRDHVTDPPEHLELGLDALAVTDVSFRAGPDRRPGRGSIAAKFGDGTLRIKTAVVTRPEGFAIDARVGARNLPLDHLQVHVPQLGWSNFAGRMDAVLMIHAAPGRIPTAGGTLALRDLRVDVAGEADPAIAWRRFALDVETIDPGARRAIVRSVALDGAGVVVKPREPSPLPFVPPSRPSSPETPAEAPPAQPWTWQVGSLEITDSNAKVFLEPPPLDVGIARLSLTGLESAPGSMANLSAELRPGEGTLGVDGRVGLDPTSFDLTTRLDRVALGSLVAASGAAPIRPPGGTLSGELKLRAEPAPLILGGDLALDDLAVALPEGEDFSLGWKRLELGIREVRVPGVLPGPPAAGEPLRVDLERLRLVAPAVVLTRVAEGLVLPTPAGGAAPTGEAPAPASPPAATPETPRAPLVVMLGRLDLEDGQVSVTDRTVRPFYRGKVAGIRLSARGLRLPDNTFDEISFAATLPGNAPLSLAARQTKGQLRVEASAKRIPLAQFNAYVRQAAGYSIAGGAATFSAKVQSAADRYQSENRIELDRLAVAGAEGDSLFSQRFGVPLTLALGLMRDVHGKIGLDVPIRGDRRGGMRIDIASIVGEALARAIVNAIVSPLKLLGALSMDGNKVSAFTPEPIGFVAGKPAVDEAASGRLDQLAGVLGSAPALRLELRGAAGPADVLALQEAAVLVDLQKESAVLGGLRNIASRGERSAIRDALAGKAKGGTAALSADQRATLDRWVGEKTVSDAELAALAAARAVALRTLLAKDHGVDAVRVSLGEPAVDRDQGKPAVQVGLGAGG